MSYDVNPEALVRYCAEMTSGESERLSHLKAETLETCSGAHMLCDRLVGGLLQFCAALSSATCALDIGTYTGYSALSMAEAMPAGSVVYTIDRPGAPGLEIARRYIDTVADRDIVLLEGQAVEVLEELEESFDLVFMDADKRQCFTYYEQVIPMLRAGGILVVDDVLWRGKVLEPQSDKRASALDAFNRAVTADKRVENLCLPIRHGLQLIRKC